MRIARRLRRDGERRAAGCRYRTREPRLRRRHRFRTPVAPQAEDGEGEHGVLPPLTRTPVRIQDPRQPQTRMTRMPDRGEPQPRIRPLRTLRLIEDREREGPIPRIRIDPPSRHRRLFQNRTYRLFLNRTKIVRPADRDGGATDNGIHTIKPILIIPQIRIEPTKRHRRLFQNRGNHLRRRLHRAHRSSSSSNRRTHTTAHLTTGNGGTGDKINHRIQLPLTHPRIKQATARHRRDRRAPITFFHSAERRWMKS